MKQSLNTATVDVVILCGGMGTRLQGVENDKPKPMIDFNKRPFLDLLIDYVGNFGFKRFILCSGHKGSDIEEYFEKKSDGKTYRISQETTPLGTAGAIKHAEAAITSDVFLAMNGDSFCPVDLNSFLSFHYSKNALASVALAPMKDALDYGGVILGEDDKIINFDEKSTTPSSGWVNAGIYMFSKRAPESDTRRAKSFIGAGNIPFPDWTGIVWLYLAKSITGHRHPGTAGACTKTFE